MTYQDKKDLALRWMIEHTIPAGERPSYAKLDSIRAAGKTMAQAFKAFEEGFDEAYGQEQALDTTKETPKPDCKNCWCHTCLKWEDCNLKDKETGQDNLLPCDFCAWNEYKAPYKPKNKKQPRCYVLPKTQPQAGVNHV